MKTWSNGLASGLILCYDGNAIAVTQIDFAKEEMTGKIFKTITEAQDWVHAGSVKQFPSWHKENCPRCTGALNA